MSVDVSIENVSVELGGSRILHDVSLEVPAGSFVTLLGPSGSGKTTTLNVLAGFVQKTAGHVRLGGKSIDDLPPHRRNVGFLFQNYALFPHLSVAGNIEFPLAARKIQATERERLVAEALALVKLPDAGGRSVGSLSGGQQQRVALARALVFQPSLLLLDEPLAALDKQLREAMQLELKRIQHETGTTAIAVTHDQVEAMSMADLVAIMNEGRLIQIGTPEEVYRRPATMFVARFLGEANLLPVANGRVAGLGVAATANGGSVAVARPEDLDLVAADAAGPAAVGSIETVVFQGTRQRVTVRCPELETPLVISVSPHEANTRLAPGDEVRVRVRTGTLHLVAADSES